MEWVDAKQCSAVQCSAVQYRGMQQTVTELEDEATGQLQGECQQPLKSFETIRNLSLSPRVLCPTAKDFALEVRKVRNKGLSGSIHASQANHDVANFATHHFSKRGHTSGVKNSFDFSQRERERMKKTRLFTKKHDYSRKTHFLMKQP